MKKSATIIDTSIRNDGTCLEFAEQTFRKDAYTVIKALKEDETSILYVEKELSDVIMNEIVAGMINPDCIQFCQKQITGQDSFIKDI